MLLMYLLKNTTPRKFFLKKVSSFTVHCYLLFCVFCCSCVFCAADCLGQMFLKKEILNPNNKTLNKG